MQRNISTIWWRFGGFVISLIGTVAWTHDAGAGCRSADSSYVRYDYSDAGVYPSGYSYQQYDATGVSTWDCDYTYDSSSRHYVDNEGCYGDTTSTIGGDPWWCYRRWWYNASDAEVLAEINSMLGSDWNSLSGTQKWSMSNTTENNLTYNEGTQYRDRQLTVHHVMNGEGDVDYVLADYGYALQTIYRIIGCASGYVLEGASEDSVVTSLDGIYCTSAGGGTTPVIPANCPDIPNDNNLITINERGSDGCFFWEADTATHNLYDATGYFKYTTDCACWDDGSRICS